MLTHCSGFANFGKLHLDRVAYKDSCALEGSRVGTGLGITDAD